MNTRYLRKLLKTSFMIAFIFGACFYMISLKMQRRNVTNNLQQQTIQSMNFKQVSDKVEGNVVAKTNVDSEAKSIKIWPNNNNQKLATNAKVDSKNELTITLSNNNNQKPATNTKVDSKNELIITSPNDSNEKAASNTNNDSRDELIITSPIDNHQKPASNVKVDSKDELITTSLNDNHQKAASNINSDSKGALVAPPNDSDEFRTTQLWNKHNSRKLSTTRPFIPKRFLEDVAEENEAVLLEDEFPYDVPDAAKLDIQYILTPEKGICEGKKIVILVKSSVPNFILREKIRKTWGSYQAEKPIKVLFMLGQPTVNVTENTLRLSEESKLHNDIIQGNFNDAYLNLTVKSLMGIKWVTDVCRETPNILFCDDDVYISVEKLLTSLSWAETNLLQCGIQIVKKARIHRKLKWGVPKSRYRGSKYYPPYCSGPCYMMSQDVVRRLYETSRHTRMDIAIEDALITGVLRVKSSIPLSTRIVPGLCEHLKTSMNIVKRMEDAWQKYEISEKQELKIKDKQNSDMSQE